MINWPLALMTISHNYAPCTGLSPRRQQGHTTGKVTLRALTAGFMVPPKQEVTNCIREVIVIVIVITIVVELIGMGTNSLYRVLVS